MFFVFPHGAMGWPAVYDCGTSWSFSLFKTNLATGNVVEYIKFNGIATMLKK